MAPNDLWARVVRRLRAHLPGRQARLPQQVFRLATLFAAGVAALLGARWVLVPPSFGQLGHYRAAAVTEAMRPGIKYAGRDACAECHVDMVELLSRAQHQTVACEACHGPAAAHIESGGETRPVVPRERSFCLRCHGYEPSRPTGFPQIDPIAHNPPRVCVSCHNPHTPGPPSPVSTCAACHGEIARVKAVSHHAALACTRCHDTPAAHMDTPRLHAPSKPAARDFCAGCHGRDAESPPEIPRIDLQTHGSRYVCWQCHYPHYPEVR